MPRGLPKIVKDCLEEARSTAIVAVEVTHARPHSGTTRPDPLVLRTWGTLGRSCDKHPRRDPITWHAPLSFVSAASNYATRMTRRLRRCLNASRRRFRPLDEPLLVDFGAHRWLENEREESYSDWLAWILGNLLEGRDILRILGLHSDARFRVCRGMCPTVVRERPLAEGYEGHTGRADLIIEFERAACILVEIKAGPAAAVDKHPGYLRSLKKHHAKIKGGILLATDRELDSLGGLRFRRWSDACIELRRQAARMKRSHGLVAAAMTLAFVSAVERNLLHFPGAALALIADDRPALLSWSQIEELERHLSAGPTKGV